MSATLGGYLKDLRLQKNISQLEIAFALGWKETSRLSRIEQGKVGNPSREILDKLMEAMRLTEEEKNQLLVVGNYLPTQEEIKEALTKIKPMLDNWPFPASSYDYTWRIIYTNQKLYDLLGIPPKKQREIEKATPWNIEMLFNPNFILNRTQSDEEKRERNKYLIRLLAHFLYEQRARTKEHWFQELVKKMMNNPLFRELWPQAVREGKTGVDLTNFGEKTLIKDEGKTKKISNFKFFVMPIFKDPRFLLELYMPSDSETFKFYQKK